MPSVDTCKACEAHCCKHVALHLDTPVTKKDIDHVRWYLLHENIWISIDHDDNWLLEFRTPCRNIGPDFKCLDYANRPLICRAYPSKDQYCEGETDEKSYTHLFTSVEEFDSYRKACTEKKQQKA